MPRFTCQVRGVAAVAGLVVLVSACGSASDAALQTPSPSPPTSTTSPSPAPPSTPFAYPGLFPRDTNITYDSTRQTIVLFGGSGPVGALGDTWVFSGGAWTQQHPAANPSQRLGPMLADDPSMQAVLLFGGQSPDGTALGDTWAWNGVNWTRLAPAHSPPARHGGAVTYDSVRHVVLLFGGSDRGAVFNDTWTWNGQDWTQAAPAQSPPGRFYGRMAVHEPSGKVVLFGGFDRLTDTWTWDGTTWTQEHPNNTPPAPSGEATPMQQQMAYDAATKLVVFVDPTPHSELTADDTMDTWAWDGSDWKHVDSAHSPSLRDGFGLTYDPTRSLVVFAAGWPYGKADGNRTWGWNGSDWSIIG
jgi:hypothetical protein